MVVRKIQTIFFLSQLIQKRTQGWSLGEGIDTKYAFTVKDREGGDIALFITLVTIVLQRPFWILIVCFIKFTAKTFQSLIVIYRRIYRPLSYPYRSL